jgi:hypothetical protein
MVCVSWVLRISPSTTPSESSSLSTMERSTKSLWLALVPNGSLSGVEPIDPHPSTQTTAERWVETECTGSRQTTVEIRLAQGDAPGPYFFVQIAQF